MKKKLIKAVNELHNALKDIDKELNYNTQFSVEIDTKNVYVCADFERDYTEVFLKLNNDKY